MNVHPGIKWNVSRLRFSRQNMGWLQTELGTLKSRQCPDSKVTSISRSNTDCLQGILSRYIFHSLQPKQSGGSLKKAKNVILNSRFPERGQTNFVCTRSGKRLFLRTSGSLSLQLAPKHPGIPVTFQRGFHSTLSLQRPLKVRA